MNWQSFSINIASNVFKPIEDLLRNNLKKNFNVYPIWIIGAPRSGTTLTYQILCKSFNSTYLSNRVAQRYRIALLSRIVERDWIRSSLVPRSFSSKYGVTKLSSDPSEAGDFFYQFFPDKEPYSDENTLTGDQKKNLRELIKAISFPKKSFISKNTVHSLRVRALADVFPESSFVWVSRDITSTAYSIIRAREKLNILKDDWWGIKPPGWREISHKPLEEKVIWQITETEKIIKEDVFSVGLPFIKIDYSKICAHPKHCVMEISKSLNLGNEFRDVEAGIPDSFHYSKAPDDSLTKKLKKTLDQKNR